MSKKPLISSVRLLILAVMFAGTGLDDASATIVAAHCSDNGVVAIASGSESGATEKALKTCNINADSDGCCTVVGTTENTCLSVATGPDGAYGVGEGENQMEAQDSAVEECPTMGCRARHYKCDQ